MDKNDNLNQNQTGTADPCVLDEIPEEELLDALVVTPFIDEVKSALHHLANNNQFKIFKPV